VEVLFVANPSRKKGTTGEVELRDRLNAMGTSGAPGEVGQVFKLVRREAGARTDLRQEPFEGEGGLDIQQLAVLATRPDRGRWLITMTLDLFEEMMYAAWVRTGSRPELEIEVKRRAKIAHHSLFEEEMPEWA
jgi:hypothetical protein